MYKVDNAIILAAGTSSRFAPLSYETHKALLEVKGEILIERQIRQLQDVGIKDIYVVVGYKAELFEYLKGKFGVTLIVNEEYAVKNNISSIWAAKDHIANSYICSSDNYFAVNPFEEYVEDSYYSVLFSENETDEWCVQSNDEDVITGVHIGGRHAWYMLGHVFWSEEFSRAFLQLLEEEYRLPDTGKMLWENFYIKHIDALKMKMRRYSADDIFEFDSLQELRGFDKSYIDNTRSAILRIVAKSHACSERDITDIQAVVEKGKAVGFTYTVHGNVYSYLY